MLLIDRAGPQRSHPLHISEEPFGIRSQTKPSIPKIDLVEVYIQEVVIGNDEELSCAESVALVVPVSEFSVRQ